MPIANDELKVRVPTEDKEMLKRAADLLGQSLTSFVLVPMRELAREVIASSEADVRRSTELPPAFFEQLMASLDEPAEPVPALVAAARRLADLDLEAELAK